MQTPDPCLTSVLLQPWGCLQAESCAQLQPTQTSQALDTSTRPEDNAAPGRWAFSSSIFRSKPLPNITSMFSSVHQSTKLVKRGLKGNQGFQPPPDQFSIMGMPDMGWQLVCGKRELLLRASLKTWLPHLQSHGGSHCKCLTFCNTFPHLSPTSVTSHSQVLHFAWISKYCTYSVLLLVW